MRNASDTLYNRDYNKWQSDFTVGSELWNRDFQQSEVDRNQYNTEADRRLQNQQFNRQMLENMMMRGYKPTKKDAENTGYTLQQLLDRYEYIKKYMNAQGLYI